MSVNYTPFPKQNIESLNLPQLSFLEAKLNANSIRIEHLPNDHLILFDYLTQQYSLKSLHISNPLSHVSYCAADYCFCFSPEAKMDKLEFLSITGRGITLNERSLVKLQETTKLTHLVIIINNIQGCLILPELINLKQLTSLTIKQFSIYDKALNSIEEIKQKITYFRQRY